MQMRVKRTSAGIEAERARQRRLRQGRKSRYLDRSAQCGLLEWGLTIRRRGRSKSRKSSIPPKALFSPRAPSLLPQPSLP